MDLWLAWQAGGQWLTAMAVLLGGLGGSSWLAACRRPARFRSGVAPCRQDLAGKQQELVGVDLFGPAAVTLSQELFELVLEVLVQVVCWRSVSKSSRMS